MSHYRDISPNSSYFKTLFSNVDVAYWKNCILEKRLKQESCKEDASPDNAEDEDISTGTTEKLRTKEKKEPQRIKRKYNLKWIKIDGQYKRLRKDGQLCKKGGTKKGQYSGPYKDRIRKDGQPWKQRQPKPRPDGLELWEKFTCNICGKSGRIVRNYRNLIWHKFKHHGVPISVSCSSNSSSIILQVLIS